jgi:hypothetical protein
MVLLALRFSEVCEGRREQSHSRIRYVVFRDSTVWL